MVRDQARAKLRWLPSLIAAASIAAASNAQAEQKTESPSIWQQQTLTGDWGGTRIALKDRGIEVELNYIGETLAVMSGGLNRRSSYEGRVEFTVESDLQKLIGWPGAKSYVTVYQIHSTGNNAVANAGSITDPSNIDAWQTTRLFTAWFEQDFGRGSLRLGQLAADNEFFTSETASGLINGTFGWGSLLAANLLSGGPAYPLATPAVRLKLKPTEEISVLAAAFSGDPAGDNCNDSNVQKCDRYGTKFSFDGGVLAVGEVHYTVNQGKQAIGLPGVYKLGAWYATADYLDQHYGFNTGGAVVSLADPSLAAALAHRGNGGVYGVADQTVWRGQAGSVNLFVRGGGSPSDRNLVSYYVDGGAGIKGLLLGRTDDTLTLGMAYVKISRDAIALDHDMLSINGPPYAIRNREVVFEVSYQWQVAPWWIVQPDIQYIWHPSGGQNPNDPTLTLDHAFIAGIRSAIKF